MNEDFEALARKIVSGSPSGTIGIDLSDYRRLFAEVQRVARQLNMPAIQTEILLLSEEAFVIFSTAPQFVMRVLKPGNRVKTEDFDFDFAAEFKGNLSPIPLRGFIWTEVRMNWWILFSVGAVLWFLLKHDSSLSVSIVINQMVVEAYAVFISIFILFTVSQNREFLSSPELLRDGTTYILLQNDRFVTMTAILGLVLAIFGTALSADFAESIGIYLGKSVLLDFLNPGFLSRTFTVAAAVLLVDCLLSISRYYLKIYRTLVDAQVYRQFRHSKNNEAMPPTREKS